MKCILYVKEMSMLCCVCLSASQPVAHPDDAETPYDDYNTIATEIHFAAIDASGSWWGPSTGVPPAAAIALERKKRSSSCCPPKWCLCDDVLTAPRITITYHQ